MPLYHSWLKLKRPSLLGVGEAMEQLELSYTNRENMKWHNLFGKQFNKNEIYTY